MLSIQIDTKSLELVIYHQLNNIKLSLISSHIKSSLIDDVRLLDTLDYEKSKVKKYFVVHNFDLLMTWRIEEKKAQKAESFALAQMLRVPVCVYVYDDNIWS